MVCLKEGLIGTDGGERHYQLYDSNEIWRRETNTALGAAFRFWLSRCAGNALPAENNIDDRAFHTEIGGLRKCDARKRYPGNFSFVSLGPGNIFVIETMADLEPLERDGLIHDLMECIDRRSVLYLTEEIIYSNSRARNRTIYMPALGAEDRVDYIYMVTVSDSQFRRRTGNDRFAVSER